MSYCLNPNCPKPLNAEDINFCLTCGSKLLLKERYRAIKPLGQGGFGRTFLAVDEDKPSKPVCVIKQFYPQAQGTSTIQKAVELFTQEAVRLEELGHHPQIPNLLAYFTQDDRQYLLQEYIDGANLAQEMEELGAYDEAKIRQLLADLVPVLEFIHQHHVIHRDIKPENIIRRKSDRLPILVDFGASKFVSSASLNQPGTSIGSAEFVAPEQVRGQALYTSDIYSLGVTCINLLTQTSPFNLFDATQNQWVWWQFVKTPISSNLGETIEKMLDLVPANRYQTAGEILTALNQQSQKTPQTTPSSVTSLPQTPSPVKSASNSKLDWELEQLKSEFLTSGASTPTNHPTPPSQSPSKNLSIGEIDKELKQREIDKELEELKSQFFNRPN
jgi:serine/threonine protein kinase